MESFAKVLSDRNRALLALIAENQPGSLAELSELSGRAKSNLSRTLKTMERYGLVQLRKGQSGTMIPRVPYSGIALAVPFATDQQDATPALSQ
jgi:predicted transcriptional regulator